MRLTKLFSFAAAIVLFTTSIILSQVDSSQFSPPNNNDSINVQVYHSNNAQVLQIDSSKIKYTKNNIEDTLSAVPTLTEITNLFNLANEGKRDPAIVANEISVKGDNAIPALQMFLFSQSRQKEDTVKSEHSISRKLYAINTLNIIGSVKAEEIIIEAAENFPDKEIRGLALKTLSTSYYIKAINDSTQPNPEILHALFQKVDDTTYVKYCDDQIKEIAREGIKNWTGIKYGKLSNSAINNNKIISMKSYNEKWWQSNSSNIVWNQDAKRFERK